MYAFMEIAHLNVDASTMNDLPKPLARYIPYRRRKMLASMLRASAPTHTTSKQI